MPTRPFRSGAILFFAVALAGCPKSDGDKPAPSASATQAPVTADAEAPDASKASDKAGASYSGSYTLTPAAYYISDAKDFGSVKQVKDDPTKHVGEGTITIAVDAEGRVAGTIESGPASPAVIDGSVIDGEIRGNVRRKDPKDDGLTGTLVAKVTGDAAEGKLSLAESNAAIVREGKLSIKKK